MTVTIVNLQVCTVCKRYSLVLDIFISYLLSSGTIAVLQMRLREMKGLEQGHSLTSGETELRVPWQN